MICWRLCVRELTNTGETVCSFWSRIWNSNLKKKATAIFSCIGHKSRIRVAPYIHLPNTIFIEKRKNQCRQSNAKIDIPQSDCVLVVHISQHVQIQILVASFFFSLLFLFGAVNLFIFETRRSNVGFIDSTFDHIGFDADSEWFCLSFESRLVRRRVF